MSSVAFPHQTKQREPSEGKDPPGTQILQGLSFFDLCSVPGTICHREFLSWGTETTSWLLSSGFLLPPTPSAFAHSTGILTASPLGRFPGQLHILLLHPSPCLMGKQLAVHHYFMHVERGTPWGVWRSPYSPEAPFSIPLPSWISSHFPSSSLGNLLILRRIANHLNELAAFAEHI